MLLSVHLDVFALAKITCLLGPSHSSADANLNLVGYGFDVKAKSPDHLLVKKAFPGKITALFRHSATACGLDTHRLDGLKRKRTSSGITTGLRKN